MPRRALIEHRPWLLLSLLAGVSYFFVKDDPVGGLWLMLWKGAGVAFLACYAALRGRGTDGYLITAVMAFGAMGDIALEVSFLAGGTLFAVGHVIAMALYWRNRRRSPAPSQKLAAWTLLLLPPAIAALMTYPVENWQLATAYSAIVSLMAASAWISRFPRYRVGIGAVLFVVSDLLIFAGEAGRLPREFTSLLIWPLYYGAQFLIATGVVQTLRQRMVDTEPR